ncbi:MAG TPA: TIM barrel protein [Kiritimatiellia bacterium]|jgi:xylose isomerase|nr:MAG: Xylose isomerase [Verrucomicrobia bacterium ADurb.Bin070]HPB10634.1 TIM barrel protein [Kiritimatiellia bacterium]HPO38129.1 TIM barrel protein [Kiritimatiellia bacterium]HQA37710.1 TIM barrel protein [Kiritimatiellia bacterium]HQL52006.1 TIM barrel protein [Kiritimatiellia bacterium]
MQATFRFTFGPWNIHEGADPFGPSVRDTLSFAQKLKQFKPLGFDGVQFHDDDAVPDMNDLDSAAITQKARGLKNMLDGEGLVAEFVAPRLWEDPRTIDGGYTANDPACRAYAIERSLRAIDIANALGTKLIVLWLAREGTYVRESKDSKRSVDYLVEAVNRMLAHDSAIRIAIEPKPNEPVDHAYIPTTGHAIALGHLCSDPARVGVNIESAHAILAGLDPSDEMGFALAHKKLFSVHLNDQNGLKFDEDRSFGSIDLRRAFNQVRILDRHAYGSNGEFVGLDIKAMRTQKLGVSTKHLSNSRTVFLNLLEVSRGLDQKTVDGLIAERDYEELDLLIINALMGK